MMLLDSRLLVGVIEAEGVEQGCRFLSLGCLLLLRLGIDLAQGARHIPRLPINVASAICDLNSSHLIVFLPSGF